MKRLFKYFLITIIVLNFGKLYAQQEVLYLDAVNPIFSVMFPENWKIGNKNAKYFVTTPTKSLNIHLWEVKEKSINQALKNLPNLVGEFTKKPAFQKANEVQKRKIKVTEVKGTGKDKSNKTVDLVISLFEARKRIIIVAYYATPDVLKREKTNIDEIMNSISIR